MTTGSNDVSAAAIVAAITGKQRTRRRARQETRVPNEAIQATSTGDLGLDLLRVVTRVETKIDIQNARLDRQDNRIDGIDVRLKDVEKNRDSDKSYEKGVEAGQKKVLGFVHIGWIVVSALLMTAASVVGPSLKAWLFP